MILYINAYFPGFATFIGELAAPAEFMSFVKDTYELNDPNTYAIYLKDIRAEPEKEYITSGSGYLKWEQVFYFDGRDWWSSRSGNDTVPIWIL